MPHLQMQMKEEANKGTQSPPQGAPQAQEQGVEGGQEDEDKQKTRRRGPPLHL